MPLYMDIHTLDATPEDLAEAHVADLRVQEKYGVRYLKYWFNEQAGKVFCLVEAPNPEAAAAVHREAHGLVAEETIEVESLRVDQFLGDAQGSPTGAVLLPGQVMDGGFRTILFTDMEGSTDLTQRVGDESALEVLRHHNTIVRDALKACGGREVKHTGDGIMASFVSASAAVRCAADVQRAVQSYNDGNAEHPIRVRIGVSAGEPVEDDEDLFGASVQLAARACSHAQPSQILVSNAVAELCIGKGFVFEDQGEVLLKGFPEPVRLHEVVWSG